METLMSIAMITLAVLVFGLLHLSVNYFDQILKK